MRAHRHGAVLKRLSIAAAFVVSAVLRGASPVWAEGAGYAPACASPPCLAPVLLQDAAEVRAYVDDFPFDLHMRVKYPNMGCRRLPTHPSSIMPCLFDWWMEPIVGTFWVERRGPRGGIKETLLHGGVWEPHIVRAMRTYVMPGSATVDVGAYIGTHSMLMGRLVGNAGKVYAFEPQRKIYRELVQNLALNGMDGVVVPARFALGSQRAVIEMDQPQMFLGEGEGATPLLLEGRVAVGSGGDKAEMRPLDDFGLTNLSLIKIDVDGYENPVLEGAAQTIAANRPVVVLEILSSVGVSYPGAPVDGLPVASPEQLERIHATWGLLERHGYEVRPIRAHDYVALPLERSDAPWPAPVPKARPPAAP